MNDNKALEALVESVPHVVWVARADGFTTYINQRGVDHFGLTSNRGLGKSWVDRVHPDDRERAVATWTAAFANGIACEVEYRIRRKDGQYRWTIVRAAPTRADDGTVLHWVGTHTDVNDHHQLTAQLERSRREAAEALAIRDALVKGAPVGFALLDRNHRYLLINERLALMNSVSIGQTIGRTIAEVLPNAWPVIEPILRRVIERKEPITGVEISDPNFADANGVRDRVASFYPVRVAGEVIGTGAVIVDVTDIKRLQRDILERERQLYVSREHLAGVQAIAHIGSAEIDLVNGDDRWSDELYRLIGHEPQSFPSRFENFDPFVHPEDREQLRRTRSTTAMGTILPPNEFRIVRQDGEIRWLYRQSDQMLDAAGNPIKVIVSLQDITERKRSEEALVEREVELRHSREHLARAQRVGMIGSAEVDLLTGNHTWSDELYRLLGYEPGSVAAGFDNFLKAVHPDDRPLMIEAQAETRAGVSAAIREIRVVHPNGELRWIRRQSETLSNRDGYPTRIVLLFHDITESKRAEIGLQQREAQLRQSREHLALAQRVGKIGSVEIDLRSGEIFLSDEMRRMYRVDPAIHRPGPDDFMAAIHPDDSDFVRTLTKKTYLGENVPPAEYRIVSTEGDIRWVLRQQEHIIGADGKPSHAIITVADITERRKFEATLREREEQLRLSREHLVIAQRVGAIGSAEIDLRTRDVYWSDEHLRLLGVSRGDTATTAQALMSFVHPDDRGRLSRVIDGAQGGESAPPMDFRIVTRGGEMRWLRRIQEFIYDESGTPFKLIATLQDITDRKASEAALHEREAQLLASREHLARAQRVGRIGSIEFYFSSSQTIWSDELYTLYGLNPARTIPSFETFRSLVSPEFRQLADENRAREIQGIPSVPVEIQIIRPDGEKRWLHRQVEPILDETDILKGMIATFQDITDRRRIEEELRLSQEHLLIAQKIGAIGSAEVDLRTGDVYWSDEHFRLLGVERGDVPTTAETLLSFIHPDDRDRLSEIVRGAKDGHGAPPVEFRIVTRGGAIRWLRRIQEFVYDASGTPFKVIATHQDITDRKAFEAALGEREAQLLAGREHLARAQRVGKIGSAQIDLSPRVVLWSDQLYTLLGLDPATTTASYQTFAARLSPETRHIIRDIRTRELQGVPSPPEDIQIIRPDGETRWLHREAEVATDETGKPVRVIATYQDITDRRDMEREMRRSQEHLAHAQRVGKIGSAEVDLASGKPIWSDALYALFGLDSATTTPSFEAFLDLLPPETHQLAYDNRARELQGIPSAPLELRIVRPDGETRWLYRQVEMVANDAGKPKVMMVTYQDITERRRIEEELRRSREHLALAQRVGKIGSAEVDLRTRAVFWSEGLFALLGYEPNATTAGGDVFLAAVHPDDREMVREQREAVFRGVATEPLELRVIRPNGELRWIYHNVEIVSDADGKPAKLVGTDLDITDLKQATLDLRQRETQLRESQNHLALAQRVGKIGSVELDIGSNRSHWSDEMFALLGLDPATAVPNEATLLSVVHPDDQKFLNTRRRRLVDGQTNSPAEFRIVRPDNGETRWIQVQSGPAVAEDGVSIKMLGTFQDITELKQAQLQRAEIERQLTQAQKMEAVGNLTGGIAHDFNNLLTVILGRLDLVESELDDRPELRNWVHICANAARRGAALTRSMMAFARQQPLRPVSIDLAVSIRDMVGLLQRTLGEAIEIKVICPDDLWTCEADPSQLQSALLNLALNARDAMPDGGKLMIDARNTRLDPDYASRNADVAPGDYVVMSVSDTGVGMLPDIVERVFEPFFTTKEVGKGSGLGLSMVYGFVKQSGGHVKVYSELGLGTTVRLYLPRAQEALPTKAETLRSQEVAAIGGQETILVVEDDSDMRELAVAVLQRLGYTVLSALDAESALRIFSDHTQIALLLTDISLPGGMNGRKLAERLLGLRPRIKVLYMSGYSEDAIIHQGRLDPGVRLLQKPFQNEELATQIRAALADG